MKNAPHPKALWQSRLIWLSIFQTFLNAFMAVLIGQASIIPPWVLVVLNALCAGLGATVIMLRALDQKGIAALLGQLLTFGALTFLLASCSPMQCAVQDDVIEKHPTKPSPAGKRLHRCDGKVYLEVLVDNAGQCKDNR